MNCLLSGRWSAAGGKANGFNRMDRMYRIKNRHMHPYRNLNDKSCRHGYLLSMSNRFGKKESGLLSSFPQKRESGDLASHRFFLSILSILLIGFSFSPCFANDFLSFSGRLDLRGVAALGNNPAKEDPSFTGRVKIDTPPSRWRFHSWLEGGWDGTVERPIRDHSLLRLYDKVYLSNTPYLEFKELYIGFAAGDMELRGGVQRYAWGRLDEYPPNDLLNPWDYTRFVLRPLEDRKIGVPSLSASFSREAWGLDLVWIPVFVPYRLSRPNERWFGSSMIDTIRGIPGAEIIPAEPDLPPTSRT